MAKDSPAVSFVVPCFNEKPDVVIEALSSVASQTVKNFECIIVDDSTNLSTRSAIIEFCRRDKRFIHVVPKLRLGLAGSLNLGIEMARSDLIARFDADDICFENRLELQLEELHRNPDIGVLGGGIEVINSAGKIVGIRNYPCSNKDILRQMHFVTPLAHPTVIMRKEMVKSAGGYDPSFRCSEDLDLWLRLQNVGVTFANLPQTVVRYRQDNTNRFSIHWRYNVLARRKNFRLNNVHKRLAGIAIILFWSLMPQILQRVIFRTLLLREVA